MKKLPHINCPLCRNVFIPDEATCFTNGDGNIFCPVCSEELCFRCEQAIAEIEEPVTGTLICKSCAHEMKDAKTSPDFEK